MKYMDTDIVAEVRQTRENLLARYGSLAGLRKHMVEDRPRLEKEGWKFATLEEVLAKKERSSANA
ncbi:hypothetical protein FACS1894190_13530 [Spirochaetia bacterium]|nr:hypothetical protein FACS1894190_13530 [Spirochaetia bacterium]